MTSRERFAAQPTTLLGPADPRPFEIINEAGRSPVVLMCEHGGRKVPSALGDLGIAAEEFDRHIAYDIGAEPVARQLSKTLDAPLVLQPYSRLVIDCNRSFSMVDCVPPVSDTTDIPANQNIGEVDRRVRYDEIHQPFHAQVARILDGRMAASTLFISVHSFTPALKRDGIRRPWELGFLFKSDSRLAEKLLPAAATLRPGLVAAFNEPYRGGLETDYGIPVHGEARGIQHVLIEIRNDLISNSTGQTEWAALLGSAISAVVAQGASHG